MSSKLTMKEFKKLCMNPDYLIKKYFQDKKYCLSNNENCTKNIVKAHLISKKYLKNISENSMVVGWKNSSFNKRFYYQPKTIGINKAVTFNGFCEYHDKTLFQSFEDYDFFCDYQQIYDISYRTICHRFFTQSCMQDFFNDGKNGNLVHINKTGYLDSQLFHDQYNFARINFLESKNLFLHANEYRNSLIFVIIELEGELPLSASGIYFPLRDMQNKVIQSENDIQQGFIFNVITQANRVFLILSAVQTRDDQLYKDYLLDVKNNCEKNLDHAIDHLLNWFMFKCESIYFKPSWYNKFDKEKKLTLDRIFNAEIGNYGHTIEFYPIDFNLTNLNVKNIKKNF